MIIFSLLKLFNKKKGGGIEKEKMLRDRLRAANGAEGHKNNPHTAMNNSNVNASVFRRIKNPKVRNKLINYLPFMATERVVALN